jgi:uncharacterized cupin superfamily protein
MKTFDLGAMASDGEYVLGLKDTGTHACYMIYGSLKPGEGGRTIRPGKGHEEIVMAVKGEFEVTGSLSGTLREGSAFHIAGEDECFLRNASSETAVYVAAGGHTPGAEH